MQLIVQTLQKTLNFSMAGKLKITTFNCQGFKDRMYDYVKEIFKQCDILLFEAERFDIYDGTISITGRIGPYTGEPRHPGSPRDVPAW